MLTAASNKPRGRFSLVEVIISMSIIGIIGIVVVTSFRNNLISWKSGTVQMQNQFSLALLSKRLYTDFKNLNPAVYLDANQHIWFQGEQMGDIYPNLIEVEDRDNNPDNGFEKVTFRQSSIRDIGRDGQPKLNTIFYEWKERKLYRNERDENRLLADNVTEFHILKIPNDPKQIAIDLEMQMRDSMGQGSQTEKLHYTMTMDADLLYVKTAVGTP